MTQKLKFPENFLWGAATAAHQIEGNNTNSDWWAWENSIKRHNQLIALGKNPADFCSDIACDSYNRFDEDFSLAQHLGHNAHRLSVEWARIEPKEGKFDEKELDHYEKVLQSAKFHGLTTFITLHHFTNPLWFIKKGGFEKKQNINHFVKFCLIAAKRLNEYADFWIIFNEPEVYSSTSYLSGRWPPQKKNIFSAIKVSNNIITAHNTIVSKIRLEIRKPVGLAYNLVDWQPADKIFGGFAAFLHRKINKYIFSRTIQSCDFIGVNYYFHHHVGLFGHRGHSQRGHERSDIGWGIHPEGLEQVLLDLRRIGKPIYITENGLADAHDEKREKFIKDHLNYIHRAISKGADVRGYLYWSLLDNFEWEKGFAPRFGLIEIDREDLLRRRVRYSAIKYAEICKNNYMEY
ncbi:MAG: glycoside hydrolase family 1 protein [Candidatus Doudnabacteria bacterium]|nr:glycoside hydrolase family 1 protein [Candidatus Doudnabacteria bacterium]